MARYIIHEAGGDAARSAFLFLKDFGISNTEIIAFDLNPKALLEWSLFWGIQAHLESEYMPDTNDIIVPSDENYRVKKACGDGVLCDPSPFRVHHKAYCYDMLSSRNPSHFRLPKRFKSSDGINVFVFRQVMSSGKKGLEISSAKKKEDQDLIITEFIPFEHELVIDFFSLPHALSLAPRISHLISRSGSDTFCTLLGSNSQEYPKLRDVVEEIIHILDIQGIGHIQLGFLNGNYYFIEAATRLSGASYLNLTTGYNPIRGMMSGEAFRRTFDYKMISTKFHVPLTE